MKEPLSEPVLRRLYLARQWFQEGLAGATDPSPFVRTKALLALELALVALGIPRKRDVALAELLTDLVKSKPELESHRGPLERLRSLRNGVKHNGAIPLHRRHPTARRRGRELLSERARFHS